MKIPKQLPTKLVIVLLLASTIGTAAAAISLFTHSFPEVPTVAPPLTLTTTCTNLTITPGTVTLDAVMVLTATCDNGTPAFHSNGGFVTPTFSLPTPFFVSVYQVLQMVVHNPTQPSCSTEGAITTNLTSGQGLNVAAGDYDYCLLTFPIPQSITSLPSFQISWSQ